jgi:hypothetical protein
MAQLKKVADGLRPQFPRTATVLEDAAEDVLAYRLFPSDHQRQLHSTNVLERLNRNQAAIERRRDLPVTAPALAEHAGALRGDCVRGNRCGRLWTTVLWFSKQRWTALCPSTAAAASTPWSNSGKTRAICTT